MYARLLALRPNRRVGAEMYFGQPEVADPRAAPVLLKRLLNDLHRRAHGRQLFAIFCHAQRSQNASGVAYYRFGRGLFDRAHPTLAGQRVEPGPMTIAGMTERVWTFDIPACPVTSVVSIGGGDTERPFELEEILVDVRGEARRVDVAWRTMFRYPLYERQERSARVLPSRRALRHAASRGLTAGRAEAESGCARAGCEVCEGRLAAE